MTHTPPNTQPLTLSIVVVSYNTAKLTLQAVRTAASSCAHSELLAHASEIIVVDNSSKDTSVQQIQEYALSAPIRVKVIANLDNKGFAAANNQGISLARGQYILLLNSDTITPLETLHELITTAQKSKDAVGLWACQLRNADGSEQLQGGDLPTVFGLLAQYFFLDDLPLVGKWLPSPQHTGRRGSTHTETIEIKGWVGGTALLITPPVLTVCGGLDEHIFMYGEDIEYCARAAQHGFASAILHTAALTHLQSQSAGSTNALYGEAKGYVYYFQKYKPSWQRPLVWGILLFGCFFKMCVFALFFKLHRSRQYAIVLRRVFAHMVQ